MRQRNEKKTGGRPCLSHEQSGLANPELRYAHVTSDMLHFRDDQHGCPTNARASSAFCWLGRSGNWSEVRKGTAFIMALAMFSGIQLTWQVQSSTNTRVISVFVGEFWLISGSGPKGFFEYLPRTFGATILDAENFVDTWHWGGMWTNDPYLFAPGTPAPMNN